MASMDQQPLYVINDTRVLTLNPEDECVIEICVQQLQRIFPDGRRLLPNQETFSLVFSDCAEARELLLDLVNKIPPAYTEENP